MLRQRVLSAASIGSERIALCDPVLSGFLRIVTHPRVFLDPTPPGVGAGLLRFAAARSRHASDPARGPEFGERFKNILERTACVGNHVPDAYLAALAIDLEATLITRDRGFARFQGLRVRSPAD